MMSKLPYAGEHDVLVELGTRVNIGSVDAVEEQLGDTGAFDVDEVGLEQSFRRSETLAADLDLAAIRQLVRLHERGGLIRELLLDLDVVADIAELLLHDADRLEVSRGVKGVSSQQQELDQVLGDVAAGNVEAAGQVREREPLVDRDDVGDAVAGVDDDTGEQALCVQRQHGLHCHVNPLEAVRL